MLNALRGSNLDEYFSSHLGVESNGGSKESANPAPNALTESGLR
jgi:hypothetical protein